jgi:hypothetical protein
MSGAVAQAGGEVGDARGEEGPGLQQLAEHSLLRLESHTASLDAIVREEIRRAFIDECGALVEQAHLACEALAHLQRSARRQFGLLGLLTVMLSVAGVLLLARGWLPSPRESARLRAEQARLAASVAELSEVGGQLQMRRCGVQQRLCVRVDLTAPSYGKSGDFMILKGY